MTLALLASFSLGLLAGAGHVVSGPDHLAALAPLSVAARRDAWRRGLLWGIGHASGVWVLAAVALAARAALPIELISGWSERLVGVVLIAIGLFGLRRTLTTRVHAHEHEHDGVRHTHFHVHAPDTAHEQAPPPSATLRHGHRHGHQALGIGALHGFAGVSHLLVLPALALANTAEAIAYLLGFGVGATAGMVAFAMLMGGLANHTARWGIGAYRSLALGSFGLAIVVGGWWIFAAV